MKINAIFAHDLNGKMATDSGELPWRSSPFCDDPEIEAFAKRDMENFKNTTIGNIVIMGYNTYLTFKKPLVRRWNFVIDRNVTNTETELVEVFLRNGASTGSATENWYFFPTIENCIEVLSGIEKKAAKFPKVFVIGGKKLLDECFKKNLINGEVFETVFPWVM